MSLKKGGNGTAGSDRSDMNKYKSLLWQQPSFVGQRFGMDESYR